MAPFLLAPKGWGRRQHRGRVLGFGLNGRELRDIGYEPTRLVNMAGGILDWAEHVDESMPVY